MSDAMIQIGDQVVEVLLLGPPGPMGPDTADAVAQFAIDTGSGLVGFSHAMAYAAGTVGKALKRLSVHVEDAPFNAVGDGSTNDRAAIQAAIDFVGARGGGDVLFGAKSYVINTTLDNKYPRVRLVGTGPVHFHDAGMEVGRTILVAGAALGTMLKIRTPYAAEQGIAVGSAYINTGAACLGIMLNGNLLATKALEIDSVSSIDVDVYAIQFVGTTVFEIKCGVTGTDLGEACDVQNSRMFFRARQIDNVAERASNILTLTGGPNANVSVNRGPLHGIAVVAQHWNGHVLVGVSADNNDISVRGTRAGGTGKLIYAKGPTASVPVGFEENDITYVTGLGGIFAEGTDTAGVLTGISNRIKNRDTGNGTPAPTAGTDSEWQDTDGKNVTRGAAFYGLSIADTQVQAVAQRKLLGNGTVRIYNGSGDHVQLVDGTNSWGMHLDGANLRFGRIFGSGSLNLGNGAPVVIPINALGNYANDAAAAAGGVVVNQLYRNGSILMVRTA